MGTSIPPNFAETIGTNFDPTTKINQDTLLTSTKGSLDLFTASLGPAGCNTGLLTSSKTQATIVATTASLTDMMVATDNEPLRSKGKTFQSVRKCWKNDSPSTTSGTARKEYEGGRTKSDRMEMRIGEASEKTSSAGIDGGGTVFRLRRVGMRSVGCLMASEKGG